jgi:hypothetical protein
MSGGIPSTFRGNFSVSTWLGSERTFGRAVVENIENFFIGRGRRRRRRGAREKRV